MASASSPAASPARLHALQTFRGVLNLALEDHLLPRMPIARIRALTDTILFLLSEPASQDRLYSSLIVAGGASSSAPTTAAIDSILTGAAPGDPRVALLRASEVLDLARVEREAVSVALAAAPDETRGCAGPDADVGGGRRGRTAAHAQRGRERRPVELTLGPNKEYTSTMLSPVSYPRHAVDI